jgi:hypothetical protein
MTDILVHDGLVGGGRGISRRELFRIGGAAVAAGALATIGIERAGSVSWPVAPPMLLRSSFARYLGDTFRVQIEPSDTVALQLFKVRDLLSARMLAANGQTIDSEQNFSIVFRGPVDRPLIQNVYCLEHARSGGFELFIVPMQADQGGRYYETIFNRLRP